MFIGFRLTGTCVKSGFTPPEISSVLWTKGFTSSVYLIWLSGICKSINIFTNFSFLVFKPVYLWYLYYVDRNRGQHADLCKFHLVHFDKIGALLVVICRFSDIKLWHKIFSWCCMYSSLFALKIIEFLGLDENVFIEWTVPSWGKNNVLKVP